MSGNSDASETWTYFEDEWRQGNVRIMTPRTHAAWLCSVVFDGARAFEGVIPDLELHCARVNESAKKMFLKPTVSTDTWVELSREGVSRFPKNAALYIRPMYWAENEGPWVQAHDPESTRWCLCIYAAPMPPPRGFSITLAPYRRPTMETMPVDAMAGCLYPNNARALFYAHARGFDNSLVCDVLGNVAQLATSNIFMALGGVVYTPIPNGTFLAGITRQRVIRLLRDSGITVVEKLLTYQDFEMADEIFSTGNYSKVTPVTRFEGQFLQPGPIYTMARELYWSFAYSSSTIQV
jgi:Branched-chain amino acid aminotransferase/4-amino-4-deoxychorismate lyase